MKIYNSITRKLEELEPVNAPDITLYTCGPTVYNHVHIGNLRTHVFEDILRRALKAAGYKVKHVMNITDIDDKTISRSKIQYPGEQPIDALKKLTGHFESIFLKDAKKIGIDFSNTQLVRATDYIQDMQELIRKIPNKYTTDDGIYFDITKYPRYGALVKLDQSHAHHRIQNDEYDKDHVADFALWKVKKDDEPSWDFDIDGKNIAGRPGWHIECSALSTKYLGQPFDIHTGGVDLMFPHHENEIAQSVSANHKKLANVFMHSEHLLVDGRKMSKSLNNFYTIDDIVKKGIDPMAFRLLILQAHYRSQLNFTWESLGAAQTRLKSYRAFADLRFQPIDPDNYKIRELDYSEYAKIMLRLVQNDLATPRALSRLDLIVDERNNRIQKDDLDNFRDFLRLIDDSFGLGLLESKDITPSQILLISQREEARKSNDWPKADKLRERLNEQGIEINDTPYGPIWSRR